MLFAADFWGGADMFGRLAPSTEERGKFFLFYSYTGISGGAAHITLPPLLCACSLTEELGSAQLHCLGLAQPTFNMLSFMWVSIDR